MSQDIELAEFIENLRGELETAIKQGTDRDVRFVPGLINLEIALGVTKEGNGKLSFKVFSVGAEGGGGASYETAHKLNMTLTPVDKNGGQLFVIDRRGESA